MKRSIVYTAIACSTLLSGWTKPALAQITSAQTNAAPSAASINGVIYVAAKGKETGADYVYYSTSNGSGWNSPAKVCLSSICETTQAPASAALGSTLYLAWTGPANQIYYSTTSYDTGWSSPASVCKGSTCAETTAAPALAASASTLYVAWTTAANTIEVASYAGGVWTFGPTQPMATPYPGTAPALAVYDNTLFLAWIQQESGPATCGASQCFQVMYETLSASSTVWSPAAPTTASSSFPVAPALGVYTLGGLYLAWTPASGTMDYADWDDGNWGTPVVAPGLPIPPGPLTPALVPNDVVTAVCPNPVSVYSFSLVYSAPASGKTYDDIYLAQLFGQKVGACTCKGTACQ
jgi:hypothetical protein